MTLLLDTHVALWAATRDASIPLYEVDVLKV